MPLENASLLHELDAANPAATDLLQNADEHIRMIKAALKATFPNINAAVTASDEALNALFEMPKGAIMLWYGATDTVPSGWAICNGQTVNGLTTPDLRDRFVVGAGSSFGWGGRGGATTDTAVTSTDGSHSHGVGVSLAAAGSHSHGGSTGGHALTIDEMPAHTHSLVSGSGGSSSYSADADSGSGTQQTGSTGGGSAHSHAISADGSHTHTATVTEGAAGAHNHSVTVDTVPPYHALHYIMKV